MADLAEPVVSFLLENILRLLAEEAQFLGGVRGQAQQLQSKLSQLLAQLRDADRRQDERAEFRDWISQSKEVAYDAEDALETFAFQVASRKGKGLAKFLKRYSCILSECYMRHRVGSEIQNLCGRVSELTERFHECGISASTEEGPSSRQQPLFRRTYSHVKEDDFIALDNDVEILVQQLTREDEVSPKTVVSICGMGGLGKTTIARKVYYHPNVRRHFDAFAWVCISQQWHTKDILHGILVKIVPEKREELKQLTEDEQVGHLYRIQQSKKCLVVLDDIWSRGAWNHLKNAFPTTDRSGSKILVTTRIKDIATYIGPSGFHHEPRLLTEEESWELLQKKAGQRCYDKGFPELGREIARFCGGLPLAVVVIGGILATKQEMREWQFVHKNVKSLLEKGEDTGGGGGGDFQKILALSYNDLPYHLKPCFLYLSIYPEDCDIETDRLYQLWMAEGMVSKKDRIGTDESMMDVAERYLGELVKRCMIQVTFNNDGPALRKFKSCRLHDLMRDLCLAKARDENFLKVVDYRKENIDPELEDSHSSSCKCRRIAIFLNEEDVSKYVPPEKEMMKHARSLTVLRFGGGLYEGRMASTRFNNFKILRTLTIEGITPEPGDKLSDIICMPIKILLKLEIGNLIHLRYLCLKESFFFMLPSSLGNLQHLETLDLRKAKLVLVRNVLFKMKNLRHLYLFDPDYDLEFSDYDIDFIYDHLPRCCKLQLSGLTKLEILENLNSKYCVLDGLCKLKSLQVLKVWRIELENDCEKIINFISDSQRLKEASVRLWMDEDFLNSEKWLSLLDKLFCSKLCHLSLEGPILVLPEYKTNFFRNLVELELYVSGVESNLMGTLEKLPNLQSLWLTDRAFVGTEIICSSVGFPELTFLALSGMRNLREWKVEDGAMPNLSYLKIEDCRNLKMIPDGFRFLRKLKELEIRMPGRLCDRIRNVNGEEGEDFDNVRHVPSIVVKDISSIVVDYIRY